MLDHHATKKLTPAELLRISRPRFWLYTFGPVLVGLAGAAEKAPDLLRPEIILTALYFLFPANLLVYGINDIFDFETDRLNSKKAGYELAVDPSRHRSLWIWIAAINIPFLLAIVTIAPIALMLLAPFIVLSIFYSAPPIRAKGVPVLDSAFNVLYVLPGAVVYQLAAGEFPPLWTIVAGGFWTAGMHAYSAIPDIASDTEAGLDTVATLLGRRGTHLFCVGCFCVASVIAAAHGQPASVLGIVYIGVMRWSDRSSDSGVLRLYKIFPWINAISGFLIFLSVALPQLVHRFESGAAVPIP